MSNFIKNRIELLIGFVLGLISAIAIYPKILYLSWILGFLALFGFGIYLVIWLIGKK